VQIQPLLLATNYVTKFNSIFIINIFIARYPASLFKRLTSSYNLTTKEPIIWGMTNEDVAITKYCSLGDAVVEKTGKYRK